MTTAAKAALREPLPRAFGVWLGGALASQLGDAAMYFALGWAASSHGGAAAGLVLSAIVLPRTLLLLLGGAVGDRLGARRVMITGDAIMLVVAAVLAVLAWRWGTPLPVLLAAGLIIGTVDAFYLPSSGSMPRRLVDGPALARAVALRQSGTQLVSMVGGPIGGAVVAAAGFAAAAGMDAATFAIVLVVLVVIRPRFAAPGATDRTNIVREALDGVRIAITTAGLGPALLLVAGSAGFILPVSSLLVPLLAHTHGWGAGAAGLVVGSQGVGAIAVNLAVARQGTHSRPGLIAIGGLLVTALGQTMIGLAPTVTVAATGALVMGIGSGLFVSHLSPVLLGAAPQSHLARIQALLSLVQSLALLATNNILGNAAHAFRAVDAIFVLSRSTHGLRTRRLLQPDSEGLDFLPPPQRSTGKLTVLVCTARGWLMAEPRRMPSSPFAEGVRHGASATPSASGRSDRGPRGSRWARPIGDVKRSVCAATVDAA